MSDRRGPPAHPAEVLAISPTDTERRAFSEIQEHESWRAMIEIGDQDDYEDALRLFCWFRRRCDLLVGTSR